MEKIKLIECPRDAMQGLSQFISTENKIRYVDALLQVGFDTIDVGSFVSPRMIPQMRDTREVLDRIDWQNSSSKLLTIVANKGGAVQASQFEQIDYLGYPFSISETFQLRNTNSSIEGSLNRLSEICEVAQNHHKTMVVYISMGFGNPYGDPWSSSLVTEWTQRIKEEFGVKILSLSDTVGAADALIISDVFHKIKPYTDGIEIGAHLHAKQDEWQAKIEAAKNEDCWRFDGAISGLGGCPYASDSLTGNIPTELMVEWFENQGFQTGLNREKLRESIMISQEIF